MTRLAWLALAILAVIVARYRPALRPVALALATLAFLDAARATGLPPRADVAAWLLWPGVWAALACHVWPRRRTLLTFALFCAYAAAIALAPWSWRAHPLAFAAAIRAPHVVACMVALWAWSTRTAPPSAPSRIAGILALSGFVDLVAGALSGPWHLAAPLSWATMAAVACALVCDGVRWKKS